MEEKELENELKDKAERIKRKDFSERWERIQPRLEGTAAVQEQFELNPIPIANGGGTLKMKFFRKKNALICAAILLLCAMVLAIVLPIALRKTNSDPLSPGTIDNPDKIYYFQSGGLLHCVSDKEEFYRELESAGVFAVDYFEYEIESFGLWVTEENLIKGWALDYYDEMNESVVGLDFYSEDVAVQSQYPLFDEEFSTTTINGVTIQYVVNREEDSYMLWAVATYRNCGYRFEIMSANENLFAVFETLFK